MKKLLLSALLGISSLVSFANDRGTVTNKLACGAKLTVTFIQYDPGTCANNGSSPTYTVLPGFVYDLDDPTLWMPTVLQSYQSYSAVICVLCPGLTICLPPVGIMPGAPPCDPTTVGPVATPCCGKVSVTNNPPGGGGLTWNLDVF